MRKVIIEVSDYDPDRRRGREIIACREEISEKLLEDALKEDEDILNNMYRYCAYRVDTDVERAKLGCLKLKQEVKGDNSITRTGH